jgi:phosphohistidine phosphatase
MKTLFLLRHAKSSWKDETLPDFERPLNSRGKRAAETVGAFLKREKIAPDLILCSCAVRVRETIEIVLKTSRLRSDLRFDERIYEASAERLLEVVTQIEKAANCVLLVGHNPGMEELLMMLTGKAELMPTATLAKITLKTSNWANAGTKGGSLDWVIKPRELEKA